MKVHAATYQIGVTNSKENTNWIQSNWTPWPSAWGLAEASVCQADRPGSGLPPPTHTDSLAAFPRPGNKPPCASTYPTQSHTYTNTHLKWPHHFYTHIDICHLFFCSPIFLKIQPTCSPQTFLNDLSPEEDIFNWTLFFSTSIAKDNREVSQSTQGIKGKCQADKQNNLFSMTLNPAF